MFWIILAVLVGFVVVVWSYKHEDYDVFIYSGIISAVSVFMVGLIFGCLLMATVPNATKTDIKTYEVIPDTIFEDTVLYIDEENVICDCFKFKKVISDDGTFLEIVTTSSKNDFWILPFLDSKEYTLYIDSSLLLNESEVIK